MVRILKSIMKFINTICEYLTAVMLVVMTLSILLQVVCRAVGYGFDWTEELARFLQIALVLLGTGICAHYGSNIAIDTVVQLVSVKWRRVMMIAVDVLCLVLFYEMVRYGMFALNITSRQTSPSMRISLGVPYAFILAGCVITFMHIFVHLLELTFDWRAYHDRQLAKERESA